LICDGSGLSADGRQFPINIDPLIIISALLPRAGGNCWMLVRYANDPECAGFDGSHHVHGSWNREQRFGDNLC
jgi:hypothetical protein